MSGRNKLLSPVPHDTHHWSNIDETYISYSLWVISKNQEGNKWNLTSRIAQQNLGVNTSYIVWHLAAPLQGLCNTTTPQGSQWHPWWPHGSSPTWLPRVPSPLPLVYHNLMELFFCCKREAAPESLSELVWLHLAPGDTALTFIASLVPPGTSHLMGYSWPLLTPTAMSHRSYSWFIHQLSYGLQPSWL